MVIYEGKGKEEEERASPSPPPSLLEQCESCPIHLRNVARDFPDKRVFGKGNVYANRIIIGEAPGFTENVKGIPFVGESGKLLNALLRRVGIVRDNEGYSDGVWVTNVLKCKPQNNDDIPAAVECCKGWLFAELAISIQALPEGEVLHILLLGKVARDTIFPELQDKSATSTSGTWIDEHSGLGLSVECQFMSTWHPAYVLRNPEAVRDLAGDIARWARGRQLVYPFKVCKLETAEEVLSLVEGIPLDALVVLDLETAGYNSKADNIICVSLSWEEGKSWVFPGELLEGEGEEGEGEGGKIRRALGRKDLRWLGHNFKFDSKFLMAHYGLRLNWVQDTLLMHYLLDERRGGHGLKVLAQREFDIADYEEAMLKRYLRKKSESFAMIVERGGGDELFEYAGKDADTTLRLHGRLSRRIVKQDMEGLNEFLVGLQNMYTDVELRGFRIDVDHLMRLDQQWEAECLVIQQELTELAGLSWGDGEVINPHSSRQIAHILYDDRDGGGFGLKCPEMRKVKSRRSSCREALDKLVKEGTTEGSPERSFVENLLRWRRIGKMRGTYVDNLLEEAEAWGDGRYHPNYQIHGTVIGRMAAGMILTIPRSAGRWSGEDYGKSIKDAFVPSEGMILMDADYSQLELRVLGFLSGDPFLRNAYDRGEDLHARVAVAMFGENWQPIDRWRVKIFNYSWVYGGTEHSFAGDAGLPEEKAKEWVKKYYDIMQVAAQWMKEQLRTATRQGYVISPTGRRRRFPLVLWTNQNDVRKQSVHAPVAGLASDITQTAALVLHNHKGFCDLGAHILATVHDSIVIECPDDERVMDDVMALIRKEMLGASDKWMPGYPMGVDIEIGYKWGSVEKVKAK